MVADTRLPDGSVTRIDGGFARKREGAGENVAVLGDDQSGGGARSQQLTLELLQTAQRFNAHDARSHPFDGGPHRLLFQRREILLSVTRGTGTREEQRPPR